MQQQGINNQAGVSGNMVDMSGGAAGVGDMDWESSHEPMNVDEAIDADYRLMKDLKDLSVQENLPRVTA